jgi:hypothetical protein
LHEVFGETDQSPAYRRFSKLREKTIRSSSATGHHPVKKPAFQ